jgi:hypothetical protein
MPSKYCNCPGIFMVSDADAFHLIASLPETWEKGYSFFISFHTCFSPSGLTPVTNKIFQ